MTYTDPKKPDEDESFKERLTKKFDNLKNNENVDGVFNFAKSNTKDTLAYILLIIGIILMFFEPQWGGLLIGLITGLYFSDEIIYIVKNFNGLIEEQGLVRILVLAALFVTVFILLPFLFLGMLVGVLAMKIILPNN